MLQSPYRALGQVSHPNIPFPIPFAHTANLSPVARKFGLSQRVDDGMNSDSEASSASPREMRTCFCGTTIDGEGIYCSAGCARSDAFSTLCNKPNPPSSLLASVQSCDLSRNPSNASTSTTSSGTSDWEATHYGSMCRADLRREERKEERRRRRAEGGSASSIASASAASSTRGTMISVASSSRVPDLIGGGNHSRNASVASSRTSFSSAGGLSRQCSNASSSSRRGYGGGVHVDEVIMEDDDEEEEWLVSDPNYETKYPLPSAPKYRVQQYPLPHQRRRPSVSKANGHGHGHGKKKNLEPFGMGKDMRDVLEEIIQMEKEFVIDETSDDHSENHEGTAGVFTAVFDRPPRTPSPSLEGKRESVIPGAPLRGVGIGAHHRKSMSMANAASPPPLHRPHARPRPPSTYGHSASLSESHTALYLATASPEAGRRSASPPRLKARNSMTFTPESAGPVIPGFLGYGQSPSLATPSRRRPNPSPSAHHPTMSGWRFPHSNTATPTKLTIDTQNLEVPTPTRPRVPPSLQGEEDMHPHLLWPPNLAPSLFPMSPGMNGTPIQDSASRFRQQVNTSPTVYQHHGISPPNSGVRLGYLLGSGDEDVDMDMDEIDDQSTAHGHGHAHGHIDERGFLPVYLRAEGYRPA